MPASKKVVFENNLAFAKKLDAADKLKSYRTQFYFPKINNKRAIYLCGNSLGLQPKTVKTNLHQELKDWQQLGVEGHLHAKNPWLSYHQLITPSLCRLLGAKPVEVVSMNQLTVNLNLMLISFYRPNGKRKKVLLQENEFPSDYYAVENQVKFHGYNPAECIIEAKARKGENTLRTEDILATIEKHKHELALVLFSAVNYYSGQFFDIKAIAKKCNELKITFGVDLAHAIGNVELSLHQWGVDFATWCSYKYLNSGPGGVSGVFVHQRHANDFSIPRLAGWWGNDERTRFQMKKHFEPVAGASSWQMSNAPILSMAAHRASLAIFDKVGMPALRAKSDLLSAYFDFLISKIDTGAIEIITPKQLASRGCQISIKTKKNGKKIFDKLTKSAVIADWREPDVIRIAAAPLYNSFEDIFRFVQILNSALHG